MQRLVDLVKAYRHAKTVEERLRWAEEVVGAVGPDLRAYVFRHCPIDEADDVFLETLDGISRNLLQSYAVEDQQFWKWCYQVARNKLCTHLRRQKPVVMESIDTEEIQRLVEASAQDEPFSHGERLDLEYAMNLLQSAKPPCCGYLVEHYLLGWDYAEIAQAHQLSYDAARMQVQRCLELAQQLVSERP